MVLAPSTYAWWCLPWWSSRISTRQVRFERCVVVGQFGQFVLGHGFLLRTAATPRRTSSNPLSKLPAASVPPIPGQRNPWSMTLILRRVLLIVLAAACVCVPALAAGAATRDDLETARRQLADARQAANDTAAEFSESDHRLEETREHIADLKDSIAVAKARAAELRAYARQRALFAYTHPGSSLAGVDRLRGHGRRRPPPAAARPGQRDRQRRRQEVGGDQRPAQDPAGRPRTGGAPATGDRRSARRQARDPQREAGRGRAGRRHAPDQARRRDRGRGVRRRRREGPPRAGARRR